MVHDLKNYLLQIKSIQSKIYVLLKFHKYENKLLEYCEVRNRFHFINKNKND